MAKEVEVLSLNVGKPAPLKYKKKELTSGFVKQPVNHPVYLTKLNFEGDAQADLTVHGGPDQAVCVYPYEHYSYWEKELQLPCKLNYNAFGENLTTLGAIEQDVCIGDIFELGKAIVQITHPRGPCHKVNARHGGQINLAKLMRNSGLLGWYFRVLQEGIVAPGDSLRLLESNPKQVTCAFAAEVFYMGKFTVEGAQKILDVEELSSIWRMVLNKRVEGEKVNVNWEEASFSGSWKDDNLK